MHLIRLRSPTFSVLLLAMLPGTAAAQVDSTPATGCPAIQAEHAANPDLPVTDSVQVKRIVLDPAHPPKDVHGEPVVITFVVGIDNEIATGSIDFVNTSDSSFIKRFRKALRQFRFRSARVDDCPVRARLRLSMNYPEKPPASP